MKNGFAITNIYAYPANGHNLFVFLLAMTIYSVWILLIGLVS